MKFINRNSNSVSPQHANKNLNTTSDSDSSALLSADDKKGSSRSTSGEHKKSFLKSPFSRRKKTETIRSSSETPPSNKVRDKTVSSNNNNRGLTKTTNPGYKPIETSRTTITRSRKGSSSSSSSSACGFQYSPRDATRTGGIQRRPDGSLIYTGHRSGSPVSTTTTQSPSRGKRDGKSISGSRIPSYSSSRSRRTSSGSESEPGVAVEISDENLSEYRAKAIRGGGGKIPLNRGQHPSFLAHNTQVSTTASTLPTSAVHSAINKETFANLTKGKTNSLPNAQTQRLKHEENNIVPAKKQSGDIPSPVNTRLPARAGESAPKSPDAISVKSSSSQKSHKSTTSGSLRSSTGSIQSVINNDRSRSESPHKTLSGSSNSLNSHRRAFVTNSLEGGSQASPPRRHSNYFEQPLDSIQKNLNRISLIEYENPPVSLEYRTIVKSDSLEVHCGKKRSSFPSGEEASFAAPPPSSPAAVVAVAAASCQTDENVTGLGLRGEDLAEINTDTQQLVGTISGVSSFHFTFCIFYRIVNLFNVVLISSRFLNQLKSCKVRPGYS